MLCASPSNPLPISPLHTLAHSAELRIPSTQGNQATRRTDWFFRLNRSNPTTLPIVMYTGQPVALPENTPSCVLSDVRMMGEIVLLALREGLGPEMHF
jgi:hypothetical protein